MTEGNITVEKLRGQFPAAVLDVAESRGDVIISLSAAHLLDVARALREDPELQYDLLIFVTAVDRLPLGITPRFAAIYNLFSTRHLRRITLKVPLAGEPPTCPSVASIWPGANWHERETYDLMGVIFEGHPALCRILLPDDWEGHPLRKDYPIHGYKYSYKDQ